MCITHKSSLMTQWSAASILVASILLVQATSACETDSTPIFGCQAANGHKFIQLCASSPVAAEDGFLQYRFGSLDPDGEEKALEFEFPAQRSGSLDHFHGATYTHQGVYIQSVRFVSGTFSYSVFTRAHGRKDLGAGVEVRNLRTGKTVVVSCSERPRFYIFELKGRVACDPDTPLGTACIQ